MTKASTVLSTTSFPARNNPAARYPLVPDDKITPALAAAFQRIREAANRADQKGFRSAVPAFAAVPCETLDDLLFKAEAAPIFDHGICPIARAVAAELLSLSRDGAAANAVANSEDPVLQAISVHRAALAAERSILKEHVHDEDNPAVETARDSTAAAAIAMASTPPTTTAGAAALLKYVAERQGTFTEAVDVPIEQACIMAVAEFLEAR